ncbi:MAG: choice-of-anchor C family protein [Methylobacteriaceae bacterium]|nr:choice-of-anchor C family protein [Methylobacteriaceae bacterium]
MKLGAILGAGFVGLTLVAAPAQAAVNLVTNGGFELGADPGVFTTYGAGSGALPGWTIDAGSVDHIGTYWQPSEGARSLDMAGLSAATISQTVGGLTPGQRYVFSFDIAGNPDGSPVVKTLEASIGGSTSIHTFDVTGHSRAAMGWESHSLSFLATGTSVALSFAAKGDPTSPYGPALDNVSLSAAVPEPGTWAMLLVGFAGLSLATRRRVRRA